MTEIELQRMMSKLESLEQRHLHLIGEEKVIATKTVEETVFPAEPLYVPAEQPPLIKKEKRKEKVKERYSGGLLHFMSFLLISCIILTAFLISMGESKDIFGYSIANVVSHSMQSEIPKGSLLILKETDPNSLEAGDDITYKDYKDKHITHRITAVLENYSDTQERGFETRGLENDSPDPKIVPASEIVGKVVLHVPVAGDVLFWISENFLFTLGATVIAVLLIFILSSIYHRASAKY